MKKLLSTLLLLLTFSVGWSQSQDLAALSNNATLISQRSIFNKDGSLFGTIYFFNKDKIDKYNWKYEYIIFDKNLNKIASNEFIQKKYGASVLENYGRCRKMGDKLLLYTEYSYYKIGVISTEYLLSTHRTISLKDNTISEEFYFADDAFQALKIEDNNLKASYKKVNNVFEIFPIDNKEYSGYLILENSKDADLDYKINQIKVYDSNQKPTWTYDFNQEATYENYQRVMNVYYLDNKAIIVLGNYKKNKLNGINIVVVDLKTGKKDFDYELENEGSEYNHSVNIEKHDDKIYLVGVHRLYKKDRYDWEAILGLYRIVLDATTGKELSKKYQPWTAAKPFVEIKENGKLEGGYRPNTKEFLVLKDGSVCYLAEKYKEGGKYTSAKNSSLLLFNFDTQFEIKGIQVIDKEKTKGYESDYLFSQYVKNDTGIVFFFHDYKKDPLDNKKKWFLGINKFIDQTYSYEEIPILSKKDQFEIDVYPAKEGYIQLREFNEKEKYNQIRLEKLNY